MHGIFDREEFLREIHTIPSWVKNGDDLLRFCRHILYRLLQEKAVNNWYETNLEVRDEDLEEISKIHHDYDEAYRTNKSEFQPFEEIFDCKSKEDTLNKNA